MVKVLTKLLFLLAAAGLVFRISALRTESSSLAGFVVAVDSLSIIAGIAVATWIGHHRADASRRAFYIRLCLHAFAGAWISATVVVIGFAVTGGVVLMAKGDGSVLEPEMAISMGMFVA